MEKMEGLNGDAIKSLQVLNSKDVISCPYPWIRMTEKNVGGEYTFCPWINESIGRLEKEETRRLPELWNSPKAQEIRNNIVVNNRFSCNNDCKVKNASLDAFLGYEASEYKNFDPLFLENLLQVARSIVNKNTNIACKPISLSLFPTNVCNIRCRMCRMEKRYGGEVAPQYFEGVKPLLPYLHELFVAGGEPFFAKSSKDILFSDAVKKQKQLHISTITNCTVLDEETLEKLADLRLGRVIISIDGITPEVYNKIRRGADFTKMHLNLKRFLSFRDSGKLNVKITGSNFVIQALNYKEIEGFIEFCHEKGIRASLNLIYGSTELDACMEDVRQHVAKGLKRATELKMDYTRKSLEGVMQKLPRYQKMVRRMAMANSLLGETAVSKLRTFLEKHETVKHFVKNLVMH